MDRNNPKTPAQPKYWPIDAENEREALGALLLGQAAEGLAVLKPEHFGIDCNREIFAAIKHLCESGETVLELALVGQELRRRNQFDTVGGFAKLASLTELVMLGRSWQSRLRSLEEYSERRKFLNAVRELESRALDFAVDPQETKAWLATVAQ